MAGPAPGPQRVQARTRGKQAPPSGATARRRANSAPAPESRGRQVRKSKQARRSPLPADGNLRRNKRIRIADRVAPQAELHESQGGTGAGRAQSLACEKASRTVLRRNLNILGLPQNLWAECRTGSPSSDPQRARVLAAVQARRSAPPPLRGAHGVDTGSAHARPVLLSDDDQFPTPASEGDDPPRMQNVPRHRKRIPFRNPRQFGVAAPK